MTLWMILLSVMVPTKSPVENNTSEQQTNGQYKESAKPVGSASQNQVVRDLIDDKIRKVTDNALLTLKNCMQDAILTAMDRMVMPRVEMNVGSITGLSRRRLNSVVRKPYLRDFTGNAENTPLKSTSTRLDQNIDQERIDDTRDVESFEVGDFPAIWPN